MVISDCQGLGTCSGLRKKQDGFLWVFSRSSSLLALLVNPVCSCHLHFAGVASSVFDLSMWEMEWVGSSGRFKQGPESHPTSHFRLKKTKFRTCLDLWWVNLGEEEHRTLIKAGEIFMKGPTWFPQLHFWTWWSTSSGICIGLIEFPCGTFF